MKIITLVAIFFWFSGMGAFAQNKIHVAVQVNKGINQQSYFPFLLLDLALEKSGRDYELDFYPMDTLGLTGEDIENDVRNNRGSINVIIKGTSKSMEQKLRPVLFPIYGGLLGYRVFAIRANDKEKFSQIRSINQLQELYALQGETWADTQLLRESGFRVLGAEYSELYKMLEHGEGDYFPRGVIEINEIEAFGSPRIVLEEELFLEYPFAMFYFVHPSHMELHDVIYEGLINAHADGSYQKLFRENPEIKEMIETVNLSARHGFSIANPNMSSQALNIPHKFWFNIHSF